MTTSLAAYLSVTFFLVITPGATTAIVIQQTVRHGRRAGVKAALGAVLGNSTHAVAAGAGMALFLRRLPVVLDALQLTGAVYLIWLGLSTLARARRQEGAPQDATAPPGTSSAFREGLLVTLLNPSIVVFYLTVVAIFLDPAAPWWMFFVLGAMHVSMAFGAHTFWATAFGALRTVVARPAPLRALDVIAGVALVGLGIMLIVPRA